MGRDVFISYATADKSEADTVCTILESRGIRCWIAPRNIAPGQEWADAIMDGIADAKLMVVVFSAHTNDSLQVMREVERAVSEALMIIPLRLEDVAFSKGLAYFLSTCQWLDALTPPLEEHINKLADTISLFLQGQDVDKGRSSTPVFFVTDKSSMSQEELDNNELAIAEALRNLQMHAQTQLRLNYEKETYINCIIGFSRVLRAGLYDFMAIYNQIRSSDDLKTMKIDLNRKKALSTTERRLKLDLDRLLELARPKEERILSYVLYCLRMGTMHSLEHYFRTPRDVYSTISEFVSLVISRHSPREPHGSTIEFWTTRFKVPSFKVSLNEEEEELYLNAAGCSKEEFYALKRVDVYGSDFDDDVIVQKIYPKLLYKMFASGRDVEQFEEELFDLDNWETGMA
jgi:hypothetical protein